MLAFHGMPPFEGMSPQEAPKQLKPETIDPDKPSTAYKNPDFANQVKQLASLAEAGKVADELYARRLAELIAKGDMEGIAALSNPTIEGSEKSAYTAGNIQQPKLSGEITVPNHKPAIEDINQANILRSIESLADDDNGKSPLNPSDLG